MPQNKVIAFGDLLSPGLYVLHSKFRNIDNFINAHKEIISLSGDLVFLSPSGIILSDYLSGSINSVLIKKDRIILDRQELSLNAELAYQSHFDYRYYGMNDIQNRVSGFLQTFATAFPQRSLIFLLSSNNAQENCSVFDAVFKNYMTDAFTYFQNNLLVCVDKMKSRGYGLTPSGDDFNTGVLYGLNMLAFYDNKDYNKIRNAVLHSALSDNIYSNTLLRWAYQGRYFKRLKDFVTVLLSYPLPEVKPVFDALISVGATSGADMLCGFMSVILKRPLMLDTEF